MNRKQLFKAIKLKRSFLCVGLDSDINKIPKHLLSYEDPIFEFNRQIIDSTHKYTVAYKPNLAFYESMGASGWVSLGKTVEHIRKVSPEVIIIADAKRGDIGNTSALYAKTFFETYDFDAVTLAPYMGLDTVSPFLNYDNKWSIILALTSNKSASDFQYIRDNNNTALYENVLKTAQDWGNTDQIMFVVGATKAEALSEIREIAPDNFLLVPGIGAQGGNLQEVAKYGMNDHCGLLVNSSRGIIYASSESDFAMVAESKTKELQIEMEKYLKEAKLI
ncbi:MAG: orotidine-5'-phosphate decarboxylase [Lentimicrobiaceae bacterium]|nr:orotidine-5'-phosphate decarboxylase [Lentimicrobiaceae bacterium]MCP4911374.1 orotidine-5'-phosphate decarboxylase [Bacteroidota bacterium]MBT3453822.1 orotidine-5'-phosphate decarboxylase [Lentimicrobiaceae bacterium]MBT3819501.1 orotidine-5'-phosphate decarboxylase [Lentimicrobiaceae bacterium]MBT4061642.1 orotidine-5'-phosphate decarboxylase [Lentimicrobiaceae bacterium]